MLIDDDLETNTTIPDGFVKKISESKILSANRKNRTSISFTNRCALLLLANNYPRMTDVSAGTTRRIHSLVFPRRFFSGEEIEALDEGELKDYAAHDLADPGLIDKIENELPGVINVLARAYQRLIERGGFSLPDAVKESNERVLMESNPLPMFLKRRCVKGSGHRARTSEFAHCLRDWLSTEHSGWEPPNHQIRSMMRHLNYRTIKIDGHDTYVGIKLKAKPYTDEMDSVDDEDDDA